MEKFEEFSEWAFLHFGADTMPVCLPWASESPDAYKRNISRFLVAQRAMRMGDFKVNKDWKYCLWRPLNDTMSELAPVTSPIQLGSVFLRDESETEVDCGDRVWSGIPGNFSPAYPKDIEKNFLPKVLRAIGTNAPPAKLIVIPPEDIVELGFTGGIRPAAAQNNPAPPPKVLIAGSSIIRDVYPQAVKPCERNGLDVTLVYRGGDFTREILEFEFPKARCSNDTVILGYLGNLALVKDKKEKVGKTWHYKNPRFLND